MGNTYAQNLVPNPSFEFKISCPNDQDQLWYATPWRLPTANTSDYYNSCSGTFVDIPQNWYGNQYARTGNAYAGFAAYYGGNSCEYIEAPLINALEAGRRYCVSFYVSLSDSSLDGISPLGAYFSTTLLSDQGFMENLPVVPQVISPLATPLSDTAGWTLITGSFVAQGGEAYIILGRFLPDSSLTVDTTIRPRPNNLPSWAAFAYYYIDDVSVVQIVDCIPGSDTAICAGDSVQLGTVAVPDVAYSWSPSSGLNDSSIANPKASPSVTTTYTLTQTQCDVVSVSSVLVEINDCDTVVTISFANPIYFDGPLYVINLEPHSLLEIYCMDGRLVYEDADYQNDYWVSDLSAGVYAVSLTRPNGQRLKMKLLVIE
jgi:hypothetical protein